MGHLTYEESKAKALKIIIILAIMTFFYEGADWNKRRTQIEEFDKQEIGSDVINKQSGHLIRTLQEDDFKRG